MKQLFYSGGLLLLVSGCLKLLWGQANKEEQEKHTKSLSSKLERLSNIVDLLSRNWKS
jgi:hypothetical protein